MELIYEKNNTFLRLLNYVLRYKTFTAVALTFILLTSIVAPAIPLLAQYYIDVMQEKRV